MGTLPPVGGRNGRRVGGVGSTYTATIATRERTRGQRAIFGSMSATPVTIPGGTAIAIPGDPPRPRRPRRRNASRKCRSHRPAQLREQRRDDREAAVPERGVVHVDVEPAEQHVGRLAAAGREQLEVARDERGPLVLIALVERQDEQLSEDIGVAVEAAVDEVRDVAPSPAIRGDHLDRVAVEAGVLLPPPVAALSR